jgi:hypothetical protein
MAKTKFPLTPEKKQKKDGIMSFTYYLGKHRIFLQGKENLINQMRDYNYLSSSQLDQEGSSLVRPGFDTYAYPFLKVRV